MVQGRRYLRIRNEVVPSFKVDEFFWLSIWIIRNSFGLILDPTLLVGKINQVQSKYRCWLDFYMAAISRNSGVFFIRIWKSEPSSIRETVLTRQEHDTGQLLSIGIPWEGLNVKLIRLVVLLRSRLNLKGNNSDGIWISSRHTLKPNGTFIRVHSEPIAKRQCHMLRTNEPFKVLQLKISQI